MDNEGLMKLLLETKDVIDTMIDEIDNYHSLKFFAGKLYLLVKSIFSIINSIN